MDLVNIKYLARFINVTVVLILLVLGAIIEYQRFQVVKRSFPNMTYFEFLSVEDKIRLTGEK